MKKHVVVPYCVCLLFIVLSGIYIYSEYTNRLKGIEELLVSYTSDVKARMKSVDATAAVLPAIVKPIVGEKAPLSTNIKMHDGNVKILESYYTNNSSFIKGVSVYDRNGDVFNVYRDKNGEFIEDTYKSRVIKVLRSNKEVVTEKNSFSYVLPIFHNDTLAGNIDIDLDIESLQNELFKPYIGKDDLWPTSILDQETYITLPLDDGWFLSREKDIAKGIEENRTGFLSGKIQNDHDATTVLSYYENLLVPGHFLGIIFSYNISPIISSFIWAFVITCIILLIVTFAVVYVLNRMITRNREIQKTKDQQIAFLETISREAPVGILVSRQNHFYTGSSYAFQLLDGYITTNDLGREMGQIAFPTGFYDSAEQEEFKGCTLCTVEHNGQDVHLSRKQTVVEIDGQRCTIDTFWDITDIEHSRKNAIRSEIAKSELLSRISTDFKKPLGSIENAVVLLMQKHPEESNVMHIHESAVSLSEMIDDVQDFADIEAGRVVPDEIPFNIVDELKRVTDAYDQEAQQKGIDLQAQIASSAIRDIVGDPQRFRQVLDQLLSNAVKFTDKGSIRISIETIELQDRKILLKCSIEDTGRGMSKQKLKNLFSIDLRAKEEGESIGLGIIIAKKLISIMGGNIRVTSPSPISINPETPGVQFSFTIQCYSDQPFDKHLDYSSIVAYDQISVLIITSDAHQVQYFNNYLIRKGIKADIFVYNKDSAELLPNKLIIDKNRYQMIVIEAVDSDTSFVIAGQIRQKGLTGQCLFVLIDSYHQKGNYLKARSMCFDYYFVKSEDLSGFDALLKEHFFNVSERKGASPEDLRKDLHILIAENNTLSQTVASVVFKQLGYDVDFAQNALDLINQMNRKTYDIIFIDLKFPPSDGFEIANVLRQKNYKLPIIAMTSTQTKENLKSISDNGMNGYVPKPLNTESVKNILLKWFV